jgi:peptidoglycan hydrolase-like protein with peptidoglycan-binding domain
MAVYRSGSRGTAVKTFQQQLKDAGYDVGPIDGIFGPKTLAAVKKYQADNGLTVDGLVGPKTLTSLSGVPASSTTTKTKTDYTDSSQTRFNSLPGQPELWKDSTTGISYVVYYVPNTEPPLPMLYRVAADEDLKVFTGQETVVYDKTLTSDQIKSTGGITYGTTDHIPDTDGDPSQEFIADLERASAMQPWLKDPQVIAVYFNAYLRGEPVQDWELYGTDYYQNASEAERDWMRLSVQDPNQASDRRDDGYITAFNAFQAIGVENPPEDVLRYMADQYVMGHWTQAYLVDQIKAVTGGISANELDQDLSDFMKTGKYEFETPALKITEVEDLYRKWLGPGYPPTAAQVEEWAAKFRANPEAARDQLTQQLQKQRLALFPEYKDETLSYEDIAGPWRSYVTNAWGQQPDETSAFFQNIIKLNDSAEAGKLLRGEGLKRGIGKVETDFSEANINQFQGDIRRAV